MNFLIIGDPIKNLKAATDSSLSFAREAISRAHSIHWATDQDLFLWDGRVHARVDEIVACREKSLPATEPVKEYQSLNSYDGVWIRKDPPFNENYLSLCWLLALEEKNVPMVNKPSILLRYHEKMIPFEAAEAGYLHHDEIVPTFIPSGRRLSVPESFPRGPSVLKPFFGHGGKGVEKIEGPRSPEPYQILQPLQPVAQSGDRRIFYIDGDVVGTFVRFPMEGEIKSNIASGGRGEIREMSRKEAETADRLGAYLKEIGVVFAGADMIDGKVTEVNITSPTGFETYREIGGPRLTPKYIDFVETLV